jgi:tetratricopeptide (TPR) repeat protein
LDDIQEGVKMNRKIISISFFILFFSFSCNLFSPDAPDSSNRWYMTGEAWVLEGKKRMWDKKWQKAIECFEKALKKDSSLSEAYFYIGKCILRKNDIDDKSIPFLYNPPPGIDLAGQILPFSLLGKTAVLRIDSVFLERKRIYDAVSLSIQLLEIIHNNPGKMDGVIRREQYESDFLIEISVQTVLGIVDLNNNMKLDWEDSISLNSSYSKERTAFRILCQDIKSLNSMSFDSLNSISENPKDINKHLNTILVYLDKADESYDNFFADLVDGSKISNKLDTNMASGIGSMIKELNIILPYYYYDDFKDNDSDFWNTDRDEKNEMNRMVWIDWDNDHKIDIFSPADTLEKGHLHIGDSIHIIQNPDFYEIIDSSDSDYKRFLYKGPYTYDFVNGDWGVDEEILDGMDNDGDNLIDEDTRIVPDFIDDDGDYFDSDKNSILTPMIWNDSNKNISIDISSNSWQKVPIDTTFKKKYSDHYKEGIPDSIPVYIGLAQQEFTSGDYGLDEEWYDGKDNDNDGLIDEDIGNSIPPVELRELLIGKINGEKIQE